MKRYSTDIFESGMVPNLNGEWVLFEDAQDALVQALDVIERQARDCFPFGIDQPTEREFHIAWAREDAAGFELWARLKTRADSPIYKERLAEDGIETLSSRYTKGELDEAAKRGKEIAASLRIE